MVKLTTLAALAVAPFVLAGPVKRQETSEVGTSTESSPATATTSASESTATTSASESSSSAPGSASVSASFSASVSTSVSASASATESNTPVTTTTTTDAKAPATMGNTNLNLPAAADVNEKTFDYIVVGGGLSGSVLARRLAESKASVLVVEAGRVEADNINVTDSSRYQAAFGTDIDWAYQTVNQTFGNGEKQTMRSGRGVGGSTLINGMAWSKPHDFQLDALEEFGNEGVNWKTLQPYMLKVEGFTPPTDEQTKAGITYSPECRGKDGLVKVAVNQKAIPAELGRSVNETAAKLGYRYATDLTCGNPADYATVSHNNVDGVRYDTYTAYLLNQNLPSLTLLTEATVGKVLLSTEGGTRATGIEFKGKDGKTYTAKAHLEVIMAAGSIKTPVILQHSGIGPASVLEGAGIKQVVDLPVGQNLIDQATFTTNFEVKPEVENGDALPVFFPRFEQLVPANEAKQFTDLLEKNIDAYVEDAVKHGAYSGKNSAGLKKALELQRDWILKKNSSMSESFDYTYDKVLGYDSWFLLPFGRGSISVANSDPYSEGVNIDPRFFANEFDTLAAAATARWTRNFSTRAAPLNGKVLKETSPSTATIAADGSLEDWTNWVKSNYRSNWHPIGTASMMSRDLGGVVDSSHRVYDVQGLRVVDGSNLPMQVSSHLMSVLYGLTERAAELITKENAGKTQGVKEGATVGQENKGNHASATAGVGLATVLLSVALSSIY